MNGVEFKDQTNVLGKPKDMTNEQCYALPVKFHDKFIGPNENDIYPAIDSVWELSDEELELIVKTKRVRLSILSRSMPPCIITVEEE